MKKIFLSIAILITVASYGALNITGQLTNSDTVKIGDGTSYLRLVINYHIDGKSIVVMPVIWKGKASYTNSKMPISDIGQQQTLQIRNVYTIDSATIASAPTSNFNSLPGTSLIDKMLYWVHQKVLSYIVADNPTFTGAIVDLK